MITTFPEKFVLFHGSRRPHIFYDILTLQFPGGASFVTENSRMAIRFYLFAGLSLWFLLVRPPLQGRSLIIKIEKIRLFFLNPPLYQWDKYLVLTYIHQIKFYALNLSFIEYDCFWFSFPSSNRHIY